MKTGIFFGITIFFLACESGAPQSQLVVIPQPQPVAQQASYQDPLPRKTSVKPDWPGTYANEFGKTLKIIDDPVDGKLQFELIQNSPDCIESFKGSAAMISGATAKYKRDEVELTFTWKAGNVEVADLGFAHSTGCEPFSGVYRKQ
jgi:hypothetical protein